MISLRAESSVKIYTGYISNVCHGYECRSGVGIYIPEHLECGMEIISVIKAKVHQTLYLNMGIISLGFRFSTIILNMWISTVIFRYLPADTLTALPSTTGTRWNELFRDRRESTSNLVLMTVTVKLLNGQRSWRLAAHNHHHIHMILISQ